MLRDWLRAHDGERDAYAQAGRRAVGGTAEAHQDAEAYQDAEEAWITSAAGRAATWAEAIGWTPGT
jgi:GrpB-like predicted nucleotidyltransferase (UPF0157 family)